MCPCPSYQRGGRGWGGQAEALALAAEQVRLERGEAFPDRHAPARGQLQCALDVRHLFITHNHHDHVAALDALREAFPKIRLHASAKNTTPEHRNRPNDCVSLGSLRITHRETPGHSEDGVTYIVGGFPEDAPLVAVVGDAVFAGSMGRGFQSAELLRQKVREQILSLPPNTLLCPGHGPLTTVAEELAHNPFFS